MGLHDDSMTREIRVRDPVRSTRKTCQFFRVQNECCADSLHKIWLVPQTSTCIHLPHLHWPRVKGAIETCFVQRVDGIKIMVAHKSVYVLTPLHLPHLQWPRVEGAIETWFVQRVDDIKIMVAHKSIYVLTPLHRRARGR